MYGFLNESGYSFLVPDEVREDVESEYGGGVWSCLREKMEKKERQLGHVECDSGLGNRFHNVVGSQGVVFPEMIFYRNSKQFRAIFVSVSRANFLVLRDVVDKTCSRDLKRQTETLLGVQRDARQVLEWAEGVVLEKGDF